jgi:hypothetical protein
MAVSMLGSITATGGAGGNESGDDRNVNLAGGGGGGGEVHIASYFNPPVVDPGLINTGGGLVTITTLPEPTSLIPGMTSLLTAIAFAWHRRRAA